ncbi:HIRAN domain-containing protein [Microbacterium aurum]|uniref:HIRAN domain-containing protein n=1 Tax=Microbacterium aurum TaxID=36805 RepID=UPI001EF486D1|nr:HIRAN domain-containing protein [Microbacterium aurum]
MGWLDTIRNALRPATPAVVAFRPETSTLTPTHETESARGEERPQSAPANERTYLPQDRHAELLQPRPDGMPPLRLARHNGALWLQEDTTGLLINVDNRYLPRLGIWGAKLRGHNHYDGKAILGPAELVREPDNPHDPNAVAVYAGGVMVGHYNKGMARRLAKLLDGGEPLVACFIEVDPPKVLAASQDIIRYLYRGLPDP